jgi:hypothetical protein
VFIFLVLSFRFLQRYPLPDDYTAQDTNYKEFIRHFGTHYFWKASLGGVLQLRMETDISYITKHHEEETRHQADLAFSYYLSAHGGGASETSLTGRDRDFTQVTKEEDRYACIASKILW